MRCFLTLLLLLWVPSPLHSVGVSSSISHIALDKEDKAYKWIKKIVSLDKKYIPDPNDLLRFRELVEEMRPGNRTLLVSGLGAAAAVTTVLLLTRGESSGSESPLPGPISLPQ